MWKWLHRNGFASEALPKLVCLGVSFLAFAALILSASVGLAEDETAEDLLLKEVEDPAHDPDLGSQLANPTAPVMSMKVAETLAASTLYNPQRTLFPAYTPSGSVTTMVVLLLFGATRLPKLARSIGESAKELKAGLSGDDSEDGDETKAMTRLHSFSAA